jgi:4-diphosphocytidyl-2-C-methyl-D-erythritol kinase
VIVFPNAKINIGLNIIEQRPDGYHNIKSCFYPVPWFDALEVIEAEKFSFHSSGIDIPGTGAGNICINAYQILKKDFDLPPVSIHLLKNIPIGAGLGGGSADGAFMLKLLNDKFSLAIGTEQLQYYASQLGSDCPFFIDNKVSFVEGTGDIFSPINVDLQGMFIAIIYPQIHFATNSAYKNITPSASASELKNILEATPIKDWPNQITNDFEKNTDGIVQQLKDQLYARGALYASMTGSGSAVYGLFSDAPKIQTKHPNIIAQL